MTPALRDLIRWIAEDSVAELMGGSITGSSAPSRPTHANDDCADHDARSDLRPLFDRQAERVVAR